MPEVPAADGRAAERPGLARSAVGYFRSLWRGDFPLARVFWTDMIVIGTVVNILGTVAAMLLFVSGAPVAIGVVVHFAPVPYNILLLSAVWQSAAREASGWSFPAQAAALVWLILAVVV